MKNMNILIVLRAGDANERYKALNGIIASAVDAVEVTPLLPTALDSENKLVESVAEKGVSDLVLHHCGTGNPEYSDFVTAYKELCSKKGIDCPPIVLFSGGDITDATTKYDDVAGVCVVEYDADFKGNLKTFLQTRDKDGKLQLDLLRPKPTPETLVALSILCQGYLAVQKAGEKATNPGNKVVATALEKMGWDSTSGLIIAKNATNESLRKKVGQSGFWDVFDVEQERDPRKRVQKLRATVLIAAEKEWGQDANSDIGPVRDLIGMIGGEINDSAQVALAYIELAKRLGGPSVD